MGDLRRRNEKNVHCSHFDILFLNQDPPLILLLLFFLNFDF